MPAKSKAQFRLMAAAMKDPNLRKRMGISREDAEEFVEATKDMKSLPERKRKANALRRLGGKGHG